MMMNFRNALLSTILTLACSGFAFADADAKASLTAKTFQFKFRSAERAATVIKPMMSADGSISFQPNSNTLVVTDRTENLKAISAALAKFDAPAQSFRISVRLVSAGRSASPRVPDELKEVSDKLSGVLRFNSFEKLGELNVEAKEGDPVVAEQFATGYRADFKLGEYDASSDSIRLNEFRLQRAQGDAKTSTELVQLLKTSLNLKLGQTVILGASRLPQSDRALMLVIVSKRM